MDFNVNVKVDLSDDAKVFLTGLFAGLKATTSTVGAVSQTVIETPKVTKPATKPADKPKVQEPDTAAEAKAAAEREEALQIAARKKAADEAAAAEAAKAKADAEAAEAAKAEQEAAATEEVVDPLAEDAPAVEELTIQIVKEKLSAYRAIEGGEALMTLLRKHGAESLAALAQDKWAAIVADAS